MLGCERSKVLSWFFRFFFSLFLFVVSLVFLLAPPPRLRVLVARFGCFVAFDLSLTRTPRHHGRDITNRCKGCSGVE